MSKQNESNLSKITVNQLFSKTESIKLKQIQSTWIIPIKSNKYQSNPIKDPSKFHKYQTISRPGAYHWPAGHKITSTIKEKQCFASIFALADGRRNQDPWWRGIPFFLSPYFYSKNMDFRNISFRVGYTVGYTLFFIPLLLQQKSVTRPPLIDHRPPPIYELAHIYIHEHGLNNYFDYKVFFGAQERHD